MAGPIRIAILADARQAQKTVTGFGDKVGKAAGVATVGLGLLAAGGIGAAKAAEEVASANAKVSNILGNMGEGAATDRVLKLAEAQEKLTGIDDVVIKGAQAKLGTFEALAKSADVAGGAFDRATLASIDLASAGFGSAESNAVQLGKALQDPIKGISALTRVGVTFTAAEKDKIKALVESGKASEAQSLILGAVEKQVGGTAEASAKSSDKIAAAFENIAESVGALLLPILNQVTPVIQHVTDMFAANPGAILAVAGAIAILAGGLIALNAILQVVSVVQRVAAAATWLFNTALFASPITWIVLAIVALVAGLVLFFTKTEIGRKIWAGFTSFLKSAMDGVVSFFKKAWQWIQDAISNVWNWIKGNWPLLLGILTGPIGLAVGLLIKNWDKIWAGAKNLWGKLSGFFRDLPGRIKSALGSLGSTLWNAGVSIVTGFYNGLVAKFNVVKSFVSGIGSWIASHKGPKAYDLGLLVKNGGWIMTGLEHGLEKGIPGLRKTLGTVAGVVSGTDMGALEANASASTRAAVAAASGSGGSGAPPIVLTFEASGDPIFDAMLNELKKYIRVNGGDPATALR